LAVTGAGITLMGGNQAGPVCVSNARMGALEELQFSLGEGPCQDAFRGASPVSVASLDHAAAARWPTFINEARATGIGAVFAYPLVAGRSKLGVLTLYQDRSGALSSDQDADSLVVADVLAATILGMAAAAPPGMLPAELDGAVGHRAEVHQATGMASVQLGVSVEDALAAIRAYAFAHDLPVTRVATEIVACRLRLSDVNDSQIEEREP
jgi:hypothetical protein